MANDPLRDAARALMEAVENDENQHGGTLNRETLRLASLLRIELNRKPAAPAGVGDLRKAADLSAVVVEPDGVLKASAVAAVMCEDGEVGLLFLDREGSEFARAPLAFSAVHWLRRQLGSLLEGARRS